MRVYDAIERDIRRIREQEKCIERKNAEALKEAKREIEALLRAVRKSTGEKKKPPLGEV